MYSNKPYGVVDWALHTDTVEPDDVVIIIDPDTVLLGPVNWNWTDNGSEHFPGIDVLPGLPVSQHYLIGAAWVRALDDK